MERHAELDCMGKLLLKKASSCMGAGIKAALMAGVYRIYLVFLATAESLSEAGTHSRLT